VGGGRRYQHRRHLLQMHIMDYTRCWKNAKTSGVPLPLNLPLL